MDYRDSRKAGSVSMEERLKDDLEMLRKRAEVADAREAYEIAQEIRELEMLIARTAQRRAEVHEYHRQKNQYQAPPPYSHVGVEANRWITHGGPSIGELMAEDRLRSQYEAPPPYSSVGVGANKWRTRSGPSIGELMAADRLRTLEAMNATYERQEIQLEHSSAIQPQEDFVEFEQVTDPADFIEITAPEIPCPIHESVEEHDEEPVIEEFCEEFDNEIEEETSMATLTMGDDDDQGALEFFNMLKSRSFPEYASEEEKEDIEICIPDEAKKGHTLSSSPYKETADSFGVKLGWLFGDEKAGNPILKQRKPPDKKRKALTERAHPEVKRIKKMRWLELLLSEPP